MSVPEDGAARPAERATTVGGAQLAEPYPGLWLPAPAVRDPNSKRSQQRARKNALWEERKTEARAKKRHERADRNAAERTSGEQAPSAAATTARTAPEGDAVQEGEEPRTRERTPRRVRLERERSAWAARATSTVVIDCEWDCVQADSDLASLTCQLAHCHGVNKKATTPVKWLISGCAGRLDSQLHKWHGFENGWAPLNRAIPGRFETEVDKAKIIYLTADSETVLETIADDDVLVIGGMVDRNRLKDATVRKAELMGVRTARLPLERGPELASNKAKVLAVNHVFEIVVRFLETRDWTAALQPVLPDRKVKEYKDEKDSAAERRTAARQKHATEPSTQAAPESA